MVAGIGIFTSPSEVRLGGGTPLDTLLLDVSGISDPLVLLQTV